MAKTQELVYAVLGAGDVAVDKVKGVTRFVDRKNNEKLYKDFVKRGRTISTKVKNSKPGKTVSAQTDTVKEQATDVFKNVTKTFGVNVVSWPSGRKTAGKPSTRKSTGARKTSARKTSARKTSAKKTTSKAS